MARHDARQQVIAPMVHDLHDWMRAERARMSKHMQLNKVHSVTTVDRVVAELGETVDYLHDLAICLEREDGIIWVYGPADVEVLAFTPFGVDNLIEMIAMERNCRA